MVVKPALHHVQIAIPADGEDRAREFWGGLLGLIEIEKPEELRARGGVWFATDTVDLHLGVDPDFRAATKAHVAILVDDLAATRERLETGYTTRDDASLPGFDRFYVDDPFGNCVEVLCESPLAETSG